MTSPEKFRKCEEAYCLHMVHVATPSGKCLDHNEPEQTTTFVKDSKGDVYTKPLLEEIDPDFILEMGKYLTEGGNKYGYQNWQKCGVDELHHYWGALFRHGFEAESIYLNKPNTDTVCEHLSRMAINAMFLYHQIKSYDDNNNG